MECEKPHDGVKNGFVKVPLERVVAQELDLQAGRADEWPQNPRELRAEKKISREPRKQNAKGNIAATAEMHEQLHEPEIGRNAREGDDEDEREQDKTVRSAGFPR